MHAPLRLLAAALEPPAPPPSLHPLQMGNEKKPKRFPLGQAVSEGIIANETLAYFIGRTYLFAQRVRRMEPAARARCRP